MRFVFTTARSASGSVPTTVSFELGIVEQANGNLVRALDNVIVGQDVTLPCPESRQSPCRFVAAVENASHHVTGSSTLVILTTETCMTLATPKHRRIIDRLADLPD